MSASAPRTDPARAMKLARQCFAHARSTPFPKERENGISRGIAIAKGAGLSLERFDIPGVSARSDHSPDPIEPSAAAPTPNSKPVDRKAFRRRQADLAERLSGQDQWQEAVYSGERSILECSRLMLLLHMMVHRWEIPIGSVVGTARPIWVIFEFEKPKYGNARDLYKLADSARI